MNALYSVAYISKNTIKGDRDVIEAEIKSILASAHKNNPALNVTGALLYSGGYFCQVIEGPEEVLEELFENIQLDSRHGQVTVLHFEPIEKRSFGKWAMALLASRTRCVSMPQDSRLQGQNQGRRSGTQPCQHAGPAPHAASRGAEERLINRRTRQHSITE